MTSPRARYQALIRREIPLTAEMGLELTALDDHHAVTRAPLALNRNVHGTGFAGSLCAQAMVTGWLLVTWYLEREGLDAVLVQREGTIRYLEPVTDDPVCRCTIDAATFAAFRDGLRTQGKARLDAEVEILSGDGEAARLVSGYSARLRTAQVSPG